jgi:hypothetical protein
VKVKLAPVPGPSLVAQIRPPWASSSALLMPAFALFFPLPVAVAATAVVHLANNLFKLALIGGHANREVIVRFGLPGVAAALVGAAALGLFAVVPPLAAYSFGGQEHQVTGVKPVIRCADRGLRHP